MKAVFSFILLPLAAAPGGALAQTAVQDVIVTARLPPALGDRTFSVVRIDAEQLKAGDRLDKVLTATPGVQLFRRNSTAGANPTTQGLSLRAIAGSGAGRALVTLDGVPQNDPFGGWVIWSGISPEIIGGADIVRGSGAGPYGAGALTGVVSLEERDGGPGDRVAEVTAGEAGYMRAAAAGSVSLGTADLFLSASGETGGDWYPIRGGRGAADTKLSVDDWSSSGRLTFDANGVAVAARLSAFEERRQSGLVGAASQARGAAASLTLAAQPAPQALSWRFQGWVRRSNLENSSAAVAVGRTAATPASNQFDTPSTGAGFNGAIRRATETTSLEAGADVRATAGRTFELFRYMGAFTRGRASGGKTQVGGIYVEAARNDGPLLMSGGLRVDGWRNARSQRKERDRATGLFTLESTTPDAKGAVPTGRAAVRYETSPDLYLRAAAYAGFSPRQPERTASAVPRRQRRHRGQSEPQAREAPRTRSGPRWRRVAGKLERQRLLQPAAGRGDQCHRRRAGDLSHRGRDPCWWRAAPAPERRGNFRPGRGGPGRLKALVRLRPARRPDLQRRRGRWRIVGAAAHGSSPGADAALHRLGRGGVAPGGAAEPDAGRPL